MSVQSMLALYGVTDRRWSKDESQFLQQVEEALRGGLTCLQLREKECSEEELLNLALQVKELCNSYGVPFILNDNVELAVKCGADGVHVGQSDLEAGEVRRLIGDKMILGVSVQTVEQAEKAMQAGADYLGVGAVFSTNTKDDAKTVGIGGLRDICHYAKVPVVAIGGIDKEHIRELRDTGTHGVALVSAIFGAPSVEEATKALKEEVNQHIVERNTLVPVLSIAGSDCSGGAGIQADLKTMMANGVFGMTAVTALVAENTMRVASIMDASPEFLREQLECVFEDIPPKAVKIGMVVDIDLIRTIVSSLKEYGVEHIVMDPVMVSTSGGKLIEDSALEVLKSELLPISTVITPNIPEAQLLTGETIENEADMERVAKQLGDELQVAVLVKGGHTISDANDLLYANGKMTWFRGVRVDNPNSHGTGCTLSSAIASNLAKGFSLEESIERSKRYISDALSQQLNLGKGSGPMDHGFNVSGYYKEMP